MAFEAKDFTVGKVIVGFIAVNRTRFPASPTDLAPAFPNHVFAAAALRVVVQCPIAFAFALNQFPGILDYVLWKGHVAPPQGNISSY
jgi:hypothetical protein